MLSHQDNETLVRVGAGTPMGSLFRLYWIPFMFAKDLVPDGQPKRVMLLGEDLVAFRDTEGRVGLIANACAHRGAPMMFGRNEDCGLRCVYHGWKYDVTGAVVDTPAEPTRSRLKDKVRITAYPCKERNGIVWTYMGPETAELPPLPNVEWNMVPEANVHISIRVQECNWLQALEGEIDSAHAPGFRHEHRGETTAWRPEALLAREPVRDAVLFIGAAAIEIPRSERPCLGSDRRQPHALHFLLLSSVRTAARAHQGIVRGRPSRPRNRSPEPARLCEAPGHGSVLRLLDPLHAGDGVRIRP